jgi:hypothetical protein
VTGRQTIVVSIIVGQAATLGGIALVVRPNGLGLLIAIVAAVAAERAITALVGER